MSNENKTLTAEEIKEIIEKVKKEIYFTTQSINLTNGEVRKELENELELFKQIISILQSLPPDSKENEAVDFKQCLICECVTKCEKEKKCVRLIMGI